MGRTIALACALVLCAVRYGWTRLRGRLSIEKRAVWMQQSARTIIAALGVGLVVEGRLPEQGLIVANHLGYLDVAVFAAAAPCCFVAKREVGGWPVFGGMARAGATIFLDRTSHADANSAARELKQRLGSTIPVLLFSEGTSTDGSAVQRFHPRLFQPAIEAQARITDAAIGYEPRGGEEERAVCWFGEAEFLPHLWKLMGMRGVEARVRFGQPRFYDDPRAAARLTRAAVAQAREEMKAAAMRARSSEAMDGVLAPL